MQGGLLGSGRIKVIRLTGRSISNIGRPFLRAWQRICFFRVSRASSPRTPDSFPGPGNVTSTSTGLVSESRQPHLHEYGPLFRVLETSPPRTPDSFPSPGNVTSTSTGFVSESRQRWRGMADPATESRNRHLAPCTCRRRGPESSSRSVHLSSPRPGIVISLRAPVVAEARNRHLAPCTYRRRAPESSSRSVHLSSSRPGIVVLLRAPVVEVREARLLLLRRGRAKEVEIQARLPWGADLLNRRQKTSLADTSSPSPATAVPTRSS